MFKVISNTVGGRVHVSRSANPFMQAAGEGRVAADMVQERYIGARHVAVGRRRVTISRKKLVRPDDECA